MSLCDPRSLEELSPRLRRGPPVVDFNNPCPTFQQSMSQKALCAAADRFSLTANPAKRCHQMRCVGTQVTGNRFRGVSVCALRFYVIAGSVSLAEGAKNAGGT